MSTLFIEDSKLYTCLFWILGLKDSWSGPLNTYHTHGPTHTRGPEEGDSLDKYRT